MAERHDGIEDWSLTGFDQGWREQAGRCASVEIKEVSTNGDAEVLLAFVLEGSVRKVREWEVCCGVVGFGQPALVGRSGSLGH
jgi:hypothetical protein